jgi:hypothetical protein
VNLPTENVVIRNCIARKGAGLITCGSETSGSIRNVLGYNLEAIGTSAVLRLKSAMNRGGTIENIYMTEVKAENVRHVLAADLNWNPSYSYSTLPKEYEGKEIPEHWRIMLTPVTPPEKGYPRFRNVYVSKVKAENVDEFISASGWNDSLRRENLHAPCKTLYNNTWCTNKVKMPSFKFGEFPDEFKIKLVDEKKNQNFHFPCKKGVKSSSYGWRWERPHGGIDFAINIGEPIYAVFDGVIRVAQVNGGYGKMILIRHYNNLETLYGHLDRIMVKVGQEVKAGDIIGYSGNTGFSTGPHLHFESRCLYQTFDPEWILDVEKRELRTKKIKMAIP